MPTISMGKSPKPEQSKTVTPTAAGFTVTPDAGKVLSSVVVNGDADLVTNNIKSGVNIFGVAGNSNVVDTSAGDATAAQILSGKKAYVDGALVTGTIPSKAAATYTPSTSNQTIAAGQYLSGTQTIAGDADLVTGNIKKGANIFGVAGKSSVVETSDATAAAGHMLSGKTGYVNGAKITGTIASKGAQTYTPGTSNQTIAAGQYLSGAQTIAGDADLIATNIKSGVNIFGVSGTLASLPEANSSAIVDAGSSTTPGKLMGIFRYVGTSQTITGSNSYGPDVFNQMDCIGLNNTQALYVYVDSTDNYLKAKVLTISEGTITQGTTYTLKTTAHYLSTTKTSMVLLEPNKVCLIYNYSGAITAIILTINGTAITVNSTTNIISSGAIYSLNSISKLSATSCIVGYLLDWDDTGDVSYARYARAKVITISGTTVTVGAEHAILTGTFRHINVCGLTSTGAAITMKAGTANGYNYLYYRACTISGTTITLGTTVSSANYVYNGRFNAQSVVRLAPNLFIAFHVYSGDSIIAELYSVSGTTLSRLTTATVGTLSSISQGVSFDAALVDNIVQLATINSSMASNIYEIYVNNGMIRTLRTYVGHDTGNDFRMKIVNLNGLHSIAITKQSGISNSYAKVIFARLQDLDINATTRVIATTTTSQWGVAQIILPELK